MPATILEGHAVADAIRGAIARDLASLAKEGARAPLLVSLQVGDDDASVTYSRVQEKTCCGLRIGYERRSLPPGSSQAAVERAIDDLNDDPSVSAIMLQQPVPAGLDISALVARIAPGKDAEGTHPVNLGRIVLGDAAVRPCTAQAVMSLLDATGAELRGKEAVVVGHSAIVGKPLALMLLTRLATTTVCHIGTGERGFLVDHVGRAEVLVVAVGKPGIIRGSWVRKGAIVIDVGTTRVGGRLIGDVEFEPARDRASCITPVPGGVGPVTTAMLARNVVELCKAARA